MNMKFYENDNKNDNEEDRKQTHFDPEPSVLARIFFSKNNNDKNKRRLIFIHVFSMILK